MTDIAFKSATELAADIKDGRLGALELLDHYLARIDSYDRSLNAVVVRDFERARERAKAADEARARGEDWGSLHGLPMTLKESYNVEGLPTTWGLPDLKDNVARQHSVVAQRFTDAGAVIFGKTNVPTMLADWQSYNEVYGETSNPWDLSRSPGGSSGGSGAALAAGLTALESGSDIAGSIRNPAHFNGVFGLKPTWGIIPIRGHAAADVVAPADISCVGPLGRSADDIELALDVTAGPDLLHSPGWRLDLPGDGRTSLAEYKVAIWSDHDTAPVDASVGDQIAKLADRLTALGATVNDTARPPFDPARSHELFLRLLFAVLASRQPEEAMQAAKAAIAANPDHPDPVARGAATYHHEWLALNEQRTRLRYAWREFFADHDILICPVNTTPAFKKDRHEPQTERRLLINGIERPYQDSFFWAGLIGVSYLPAAVGPVGMTGDGLPVGLQFVAPETHDKRAINFARLVAREFGGFTPPPGFDG